MRFFAAISLIFGAALGIAAPIPDDILAPAAEPSGPEAQCWGSRCGGYPWKREDRETSIETPPPSPTPSGPSAQCWLSICGGHPWKRDD